MVEAASTVAFLWEGGRKTICVDRDATVLDVSKAMRRYGVQELVVAQRANGAWVAVGVVFARDIVNRVVATELDANVMTAGDIAWNGPAAVAHGAERLGRQLGVLRASERRLLPIADHGGTIAALVPLDDLFPLSAAGSSVRNAR